MSDFLPLVIFGLNVVTAFASCIAAVISVQNARKPASVQLQSDVEELVTLVDKMMKEQRKEKMSRVRNAAKDCDATGADTGSPAPSLHTGKAQLRQIARARGMIT